MRQTATALALLVAAVAAAAPARAQSLEDRLRTQLVAVTGQLREAQAAQAGLQAQKAAAEKERDALKAKVGSAERRPRAPARPSVPPAALAAAQAKAAQAEQAAATASAERDGARAELARVEGENAGLRASGQTTATRAAEGGKALAACQAKNVQAVQVARDLLAAYSRVSVADVLARKEPLTGLARVRIERIEQDLGDRVYDSRLDVTPRPAAPPASASSSPTPPPPRP